MLGRLHDGIVDSLDDRLGPAAERLSAPHLALEHTIGDAHILDQLHGRDAALEGCLVVGLDAEFADVDLDLADADSAGCECHVCHQFFC